MKILVTGGAGFIGGNFLHLMTEKHPEDIYVCVDALTYAGNLETLEPLKGLQNFCFVHADITDAEAMEKLFAEERFDAVINFAAETHVDRSIENPQLFLKSNVLGTSVLLDLSLKYKVGRFHQVSTDEVYGDLPLDRPELLFSETSPIRTSSPYSASKAGADLLVLSYFRTFDAPVTISRCSNNYGPYQFPEKLIPLLIDKATRDEPLPIYGDGLNVRDWLHVYDHCEAIDLILRKGRIGEVYNVGGNNERSNIEIAKTVLEALSKSINLIRFVKDRPGHDRRYAIDSTKIQNELGWRPHFSFEGGIQSTIQWNLKHTAWLTHVKSGEYLQWIDGHYLKV